MLEKVSKKACMEENEEGIDEENTFAV